MTNYKKAENVKKIPNNGRFNIMMQLYVKVCNYSMPNTG